MNPARTTARTAGLLYLLLAVTGGFSMLYVPSLIVSGDAAATASTISAHESLFRLGIVLTSASPAESGGVVASGAADGLRGVPDECFSRSSHDPGPPFC
jgi:hypothetical protein